MTSATPLTRTAYTLMSINTWRRINAERLQMLAVEQDSRSGHFWGSCYLGCAFYPGWSDVHKPATEPQCSRRLRIWAASPFPRSFDSLDSSCDCILVHRQEVALPAAHHSHQIDVPASPPAARVSPTWTLCVASSPTPCPRKRHNRSLPSRRRQFRRARQRSRATMLRMRLPVLVEGCCPWP